ncbi:MAG: radical SAM protein [Deltaproteobacteria bacterium]|nr:radical SAM protein [Deltaproteobacteria bacterium]
MRRPSVLLTSVFGPFGLDDAYGRKENVLELFHNQVTREQGLFSLRFNHQSFGLYLMAENIEAPTTVLDFPSQARFIRELRKGYDYVGISFIVPNFAKAQRMAALVREHAPKSQIILGGHGTRIPRVETLIEHDHICRGEGVFWLRRLLGEDLDRPVVHPVIASSFNKRMLGIPLAVDAAVLLPGVGCPNQCRFCATSHFFDKRYTPYFDTGRALFDICRKVEDQTGHTDFFVMDENFLKRPERARELLALMEEHDKTYRFGLFSSAETIRDVGVDFLARLGVYFLWIGVESKVEVFEKNLGVDLGAMIRELKGNGISVLASGILFLEHHDLATIWEDIEYVSSLGADFVQFMQLGPLPGTQLYREYDRKGMLRKDLPYEEWHGQHRIWFTHPNFTPAQTENLIRRAFQYEYDTNGPSLLRMFETTLLGLRALADTRDPYLLHRRRNMEREARHVRPALSVILRHAHNERSRDLAREVIRAYDETLGEPGLKQRLLTVVAGAAALREAMRVAVGANVYQPKTFRTRYRWGAKQRASEQVSGRGPKRPAIEMDWGQRAARVAPTND